MDFGSYRDDVVLIASALVNHLTEGVDGTRSYEVPVDARARRARALQITALAGRRLNEDDLGGLVELAARLRPIFQACSVGKVDAAARLVNTLLTGYQSAPVLSRHGGEPWHLHYHESGVALADGWGAGCATGLATVIGAGEAHRLGVCTAAPCDRVFVDTSRNANRRFCTARCTNRAGVAAHRARWSAELTTGAKDG